MANESAPDTGSGGIEVDTVIVSAERLWAAFRASYITPSGRIEWAALATGVFGALALTFSSLAVQFQQGVTTAFAVLVDLYRTSVETEITRFGDVLTRELQFDPLQGFGLLSLPANAIVALLAFAVLTLAIAWYLDWLGRWT